LHYTVQLFLKFMDRLLLKLNHMTKIIFSQEYYFGFFNPNEM